MDQHKKHERRVNNEIRRREKRNRYVRRDYQKPAGKQETQDSGYPDRDGNRRAGRKPEDSMMVGYKNQLV